ncbi:MAG TPA: hypothetical protein VLK33_23055 [Terriglobales bacterium]|nr:hypothetical protein [Terriglobales bacterium]
MTLQPSTLYATDTNLERRRRALINSEPARDHEILDCWNPDCPSCQRWREWAKQIAEVNGEIKTRQSK